MKYIILLCLTIILLTGCTTTSIVDIEKETYLSYKEEILTTNDFTSQEDLNFNIEINTTRISPEELSYKLVINNPKEDMYNIKVLLIHNKITDNIFPSIGIFNTEQTNLLIKDNNSLSLVGTILSTKDIDIEYKVYIEYTNNNNDIEKIYYKTTN